MASARGRSPKYRVRVACRAESGGNFHIQKGKGAALLPAAVAGALRCFRVSPLAPWPSRVLLLRIEFGGDD